MQGMERKLRLVTAGDLILYPDLIGIYSHAESKTYLELTRYERNRNE